MDGKMEGVNLGWRKLTDAGADVTNSGAYDLRDSEGHCIKFTLEMFISDFCDNPLFHRKIDVSPADKWVWNAPSFGEYAVEIKELLVGKNVCVLGDGYGGSYTVEDVTKRVLRRLYKDSGLRYGWVRSLVMSGGFLYFRGEDSRLPWAVEGFTSDDIPCRFRRR